MGRKDIKYDGKPFQKGDPRINRKGRPKKLPKLDELLADVLGANDNGKTQAQRILEALRTKARNGDVKAAQLLLDRGYGKVKENIDITTNDESLNNKPVIEIKIIKPDGEGEITGQ